VIVSTTCARKRTHLYEKCTKSSAHSDQSLAQCRGCSADVQVHCDVGRCLCRHQRINWSLRQNQPRNRYQYSPPSPPRSYSTFPATPPNRQRSLHTPRFVGTATRRLTSPAPRSATPLHPSHHIHHVRRLNLSSAPATGDPATPTSASAPTRFPMISAVNAASSAPGKSLVPRTPPLSFRFVSAAAWIDHQASRNFVMPRPFEFRPERLRVLGVRPLTSTRDFGLNDRCRDFAHTCSAFCPPQRSLPEIRAANPRCVSTAQSQDRRPGAAWKPASAFHGRLAARNPSKSSSASVVVHAARP